MQRFKHGRLFPWLALAVAFPISTFGESVDKLSKSAADELARESWAYSVGLQAYVFGLPLVIFEREYALRTDRERIERIQDKCPCAVVNEVGHSSRLATAADVMPYTPNNDTVYSGIVLALSEEPIILSLPDIGDRYWSVQIANPYTENQLYIGTRTTEGLGGHFAFVGPDWQGELPPDVIGHRMQYDAIMLAVRIAVIPEDPEDLDIVRTIQQGIVTTSLSNFIEGDLGVTQIPASAVPRPSYEGELKFFQLLADLMTLYPPAPEHQAHVNSFMTIGLEVGKAFDPGSLDGATRRGLIRAVNDGEALMRWKVTRRGTPYRNSWNNLREGSYGFDYLDRAAGALEGLFVHDREEAVYFSTYRSADGQFLDGTKRYTIHFDRNEFPATLINGFWSLTMYGPDFQLVANEIDRYSISDRTDGLQYNDDGSLDIYVQNSPPPGKESNWLPSPPEGIFRINYRVYLPQEPARNPETLEYMLVPIEAVE